MEKPAYGLIVVALLCTLLVPSTVASEDLDSLIYVSEDNGAFHMLTDAIHGDVLVKSTLNIAKSNGKVGDTIDLVGLTTQRDSNNYLLSLRAVLAQKSWFYDRWEIQLVSDDGLLGEMGSFVLYSDSTGKFTDPKNVYSAVMGYKRQTGEVSVRLTNLTSGTILCEGFAYVPVVYDPLYGRCGSKGQSTYEMTQLHITEGYERLGTALVLNQLKAGVITAAGRVGYDVYVNEDPLQFSITRTAGFLPGNYVLVFEDTGQEIFTLPAQESAVVDLGHKALPPGEYTGLLRYVEEGYTQDVLRVPWWIIGPEVSLSISVSTESGLFQDAQFPVQGEIKLQSNQRVDDLRLLLATTSGESILTLDLDHIDDGRTIPFEIARLDRALKDLELVAQLVDQQDGTLYTQGRWSGMQIELHSYDYYTDELTDRITAGDSLVRVWIHSSLSTAEMENIVARVVFTSPSGKEIPTFAKRITLPVELVPNQLDLQGKEVGRRTWAKTGHLTYAWHAPLLPLEPGPWTYQVELYNIDQSLRHFRLNEREDFIVWREPQEVLFTGEGGSFYVEAAMVRTEPCSTEVVGLEVVPGSVIKLEQVMADWDKHLYRPTLNQTFTRYAVGGTDLGQSFAHGDRLIFLFGDTIGSQGFIESFAAQSRTEDPEAEGGLKLEVFTDRWGNTLRMKPPGISMGGFEVPTGGFSLNDKIYMLVRTSWRDGIGRSVLVHLDEEHRMYRPIREFSPVGGRFVEINAHVAPKPIPGLEDMQEPVVFWGSGENYRKSDLFLGVISAQDIEKPGAMKYYAGLNQDGIPIWADQEKDAVAVVKEPVFGEFSVIWCNELQIWLLAYGGGDLRWAKEPWGPWSERISIPNHAVAANNYLYTPSAPSDLAGPVIGPEPLNRHGGCYGFYMIEKFTKVKDDILRVYYLLSTWNPYVVVLQRMDLKVTFDN